jgi:hypothetical protein
VVADRKLSGGDPACVAVVLAAAQDKANLERQLKQLNSKSTLLEKNLEKKDAQVSTQPCQSSLGLCCFALVYVLVDILPCFTMYMSQ